MMRRHQFIYLCTVALAVMILSACLGDSTFDALLEPPATTVTIATEQDVDAGQSAEPTEPALQPVESPPVLPTISPATQPQPTETPIPRAVPKVKITPQAVTQTNSVTYFIATDGKDSNQGTTIDTPFETLDKALRIAQPGDVIHLTAGDYYEDITTYRDGQPNAPITIKGPPDAELHGADEDNAIVRVFHNYHHFYGFTIDGLHGDDDEPSGFSDKLVYAQSHAEREGITGLVISNMTLKNAGGECLRLRYFANNNIVEHSTIKNCGIHDFRFDDGDKKNGEGIYIGTASNQWDDGKNRTNDPDESNHNWIHHNYINTRGNECVDIKEGSSGNLIEHNFCTGQRDPDSAGIGSRGDDNTIRYNEIYDNKGGGVRLGGHTVDDVVYGVGNFVYGNVIYGNVEGGIKLEAIPQGDICDNQFADNKGEKIFGTYSDAYSAEFTCN